MTSEIEDTIEKAVVKSEKEPLVIFKTKEDKYGRDITVMSDFFDGYVQQMSCWIFVRKMNASEIRTKTTAYRVMEAVGISYRPKRKPNGITKSNKEARKCGLEVGENYNLAKSEDSKEPNV